MFDYQKQRIHLEIVYMVWGLLLADDGVEEVFFVLMDMYVAFGQHNVGPRLGKCIWILMLYKAKEMAQQNLR